MLGAASIISRAVSAPARWPADRGSPLAVAHRPLPSEMMATWMAPLFGRVLERDSIEVKEGIAASLISIIANYSVKQSKYTINKMGPRLFRAYFSRVARINASM